MHNAVRSVDDAFRRFFAGWRFRCDGGAFFFAVEESTN